jgi:predicted urease superfamily metal-dependent hydrolase
MALIGVEKAIKHTCATLNSKENVYGIQILSYKRNRFVSVTRNGEDFVIEEKGYLDQKLNSNFKHLPRLLKTIFKREFPRSRKLRMILLENEKGTRKNLKKL